VQHLSAVVIRDSLLAAESPMTGNGFGGLRVLAFESRRSSEMAKLIENNGGKAIVVPAAREVPSACRAGLSEFAESLLEGSLDLVIFLTGVGTRALAQAMEQFCSRAAFVAALSRVSIAARGSKPATALRELGVPITWNVPEPNTWREILQLLDEKGVALKDRRVAIQEYGVPSQELLTGLLQRGAKIRTVHVYDWALPEDRTPLKNAIMALEQRHIDVTLFTAAVQVHHLIEVADEMNARESLIRALNETTIASIGPVTSEQLREYGIRVVLEPSHPKMGLLVSEAAIHHAVVHRKCG
jgi:uroporphyrinogen-III synthase